MTISANILNDNIKVVSENNTLLDMLLEFEKTLDSLDLYAFKNWHKGEILEGPNLRRHYVNVKLMYPYESMPDPEGAKRLMARDCLVKYKKDTLITPRKVKTFDDVEVDTRPNGQTRYKAKTKSQPVWVVSVDMPRRYVDEFSKDVVEVDNNKFVDMEDVKADGNTTTPQTEPQFAEPGGLL
ncbi:hypothetical protein N9N08_00295 [bacterium]|jgi:hypothetical protein|nr:hypothetical protein [bacterium]